jgi:hypothetical protein
MSPSSMNDTDRIISDFAVNLIGDKNAKQGKAKFINNYPIHGARSCVYGFDNEGNPIVEDGIIKWEIIAVHDEMNFLAKNKDGELKAFSIR